MLTDSQIAALLPTTIAALAAGRESELPLDLLEREWQSAELEKLQASLHAFVRACWPVIEPGKRFVDGWHIGAICEHLEAVISGQLKRLVICVPPRCSKSSIVSVCWPAWAWVRNPSMQWLCLSHSDRLAARDNRRMRVLVSSPWYQERWPVTFARDENLKTSFWNDANGYRVSSSLLASYLGMGADILVLDDPMDRDDAFSDLRREAIIDAYREKASTRLNDATESAIVAIGQRLHDRDLLGYLAENGFERLTIPMEYENNHSCGTTTGWIDPRTEDGELMCPERFPPEHIERQKQTLGSFAWAGQMQQRPAPRGGGMFRREWFEIVAAMPAKAAPVRSWGKAATEAGGCYSVGVLISQTHAGLYYIEDVVRKQVSPDGRHRLMRQVAELDAARDLATEQLIEAEGGSSGKDAVVYEARLLSGYNVHFKHPTGSKEIRAMPFASQCEAGNMKLVRGPWNEAFLQELETFPAGKYKDQVDAASQGFSRLAMALDGRIPDDLLASGEDPLEESRPFTEEEIGELPDFLAELVTTSRSRSERRRSAWRDEPCS